MILRPPSVFTTGEMCACTARIAFTKALSDDVAVAKCAAVTRAGGPVIFSGIPTPRWGLPYSTQIGCLSLITLYYYLQDCLDEMSERALCCAVALLLYYGFRYDRVFEGL